MLNGYRRGEQSGTLVAHMQPDMTVSDMDTLTQFALYVLTALRKQGYAHLEPGGDFISGFVSGFSVAQNTRALIGNAR